MNDIKLKPCPFCGGEATVVHDKDWLRIACKNKGCEVAPSTGFHKTLKVAADVWNDRATEHPVTIGSKIYSIFDADGETHIEELTVTEVGIKRLFCSGFVPPKDDLSLEIPLDEIGKTYFFTREEAERVRAERSAADE